MYYATHKSRQCERRTDEHHHARREQHEACLGGGQEDIDFPFGELSKLGEWGVRGFSAALCKLQNILNGTVSFALLQTSRCWI
jgi:hypothetical protein